MGAFLPWPTGTSSGCGLSTPLDARAIERTVEATYPFWSPDGASIGFFADGQLKKVSLASGLVQTVCEAIEARGGAWGRNGVIIFGGVDAGLQRVSEQGGVPEELTRLPPESSRALVDAHRYPQFLPDGEHFLYLYLMSDPDVAGIYVGSLDGTAPERVLDGREVARYAPPAQAGGIGHLLLRRQQILMAQPFDTETRQVRGGMFPVPNGSG